MIDPPTRQGLVTLVAPAFNESGNAADLVDFCRHVRANRPEYEFELIVVDDGSTDDTAARVLDEAQQDGPVRVVTLSRRFGSHAALGAGLAASAGDCVITISTDVQEPVELVDRFLNAWRDGYDVVWGVRTTRAGGGPVSNLASQRFTRLFRAMSGLDRYPVEGPSQALLSRRVVDVLNALPERNRNLWAIVAWLGFDQTSVAFDQRPRRAGRSKWTTSDRMKLMVDSIVAFSARPFAITTGVGLALAGGGTLALVILVLVGLLVAWPGGWALVLACLLLLAGTQLVVLGGLGLYVWRIAEDARARPLYVVSRTRDAG